MKPAHAILTLLALTGCPYISEQESAARRDLDGDGVVAVQAGGTDCDDSDASVGVLTWYLDADGDGFGDPAQAQSGCELPSDGGAWVTDASDCDDTLADVFPGAEERCNGVDDSCDGVADAGAEVIWYHDGDGDGFGNPEDTFSSCVAPSGFVAEGGDCDDARATVAPGAPETCDGVDNDCDTLVDDADSDVVDPPSWYADADQDGYGDVDQATTSCTAPTGAVGNGDDCDDTTASVQPGQGEVCNGVDDDCDGLVDDGAIDPTSWYGDADGDGHGAPDSVVTACYAPTGAVAKGDDCDDADPALHPGATEVCNGLDDDCNGQTDEAGAQGMTAFYGDGDGDGHGSPDVSTVACVAPSGFSALQDDCDDTDPNVHAAMNELCDGVDNDCDGLIDDDAVESPWMADADRDGFGDPNDVVLACIPPAGRVLDDTDCDDTKADISPNGAELCDGLDNDCDGLVDDADPQLDAPLFYADADEDGFGLGSSSRPACSLPAGYATQKGDCDDASGAVYPGADEVCDALDNDCDGLIDDADTYVLDAQTWRPDADLDGYGSLDTTKRACAGPSGWLNTGGDCDDANPAVHVGATEVCDGADNDCDGVADGPDAADVVPFYADTDADRYGDAASSTLACSAPTGFVTDATDCDDAAKLVHPGATELCDAVDNDCNGLVDDDALPVTWYADVDLDGYGDPGSTVASCADPGGHVLGGTDCDDADAAVFPGADEVCNSVDDDCNGLLDDADPGVVDPAPWYDDADGDGFGDVRFEQLACVQPSGTSGASSDCDDTKGTVHPGADEVCNGLDDDCDRAVDDADSGVIGRPLWYRDFDSDTFGDVTRTVKACAAPGGYIPDGTDCDDADAAVSPAALERCNNIDDNCDGVIDEATAVDASTWFTDADGDTFGVPSPTTAACSQPTGFSANDTDCDDTSTLTNPSASEICDFKDNNCNGQVDEGALPRTWYADTDADTFGDPNVTALDCAQPPGHVTNALDCDDTKNAIHPVAPEVCNTVDDDCDGLVDGADPGLTNGVTYYKDADNDTYGDAKSTAVACSQPTGWRSNATDCDDTRAAVNPGATEVCADGLDNDCDGTANTCTGFGGTYTAAGANGLILGVEPAGRVATAVSTAGDTNNDGSDDLWLGGPLTPNGRRGQYRGAVFLMESAYPTLDTVLSASVTIAATVDNTGFGESIVGGVDLSGDGKLDLLVGAGFDDTTFTDGGQVYLFSDPVGAGASRPNDALATYRPEGAHRLGATVAVGDLNGDGKPDLLFGAPLWDNGGGNANKDWGSAYVIYGPTFASQSVANADARLRGEGQNDRAGSSIAAVGDVNGDGIGDLLIGAPLAPRGGPTAQQGRAYLVFGPPPALLGLANADVIFEGELASDLAGSSVAGVGDVNGDGYADLLIGAPHNDGGATNGGAAYLVLGSASLGGTLNLSAADAILRGSVPGSLVGAAVGTAGDVDQDGFPDLVIGATGYSTTAGAVGAVYLVRGPVAGILNLDTQATARFEGALAGDNTGLRVGAMGDLNGDGYDDVCVAAPQNDVTARDAGAMGFFYSFGGL